MNRGRDAAHTMAMKKVATTSTGTKLWLSTPDKTALVRPGSLTSAAGTVAGDKLLQQARRQYVHILRPYWRLSVTSGAQARQMAVVAEYGSMCSLFSVQKVCRHRNSAIAT